MRIGCFPIPTPTNCCTEAPISANTLGDVPIRILLAPWWVRMFYTSVIVAVCVFAGLAVARSENRDMRLPALGIALIVIACLVVASLLTAAAGQSRDKYVEALGPVLTPDERNDAIRAAWRGPIPDNPRVRDAAGRLALLYSSALQRRRGLEITGYVLMAIVFPLNVATALADDKPVRAVLFAILGALVVGGAVWQRSQMRRARDRASRLR